MTVIMTEFEQLAHDRWEAGVNEFRAGDARKPFSGDPINEAISECLDLYNYSVEAWEEHRIPKDKCTELCRLAFAAFVILRELR